MNHSKYLRGAAVLTLGGLAAKAIGAMYRIPLTNLLGGYGMGLYQMAYPVFCVLLTFSSAGIPSAFSRVIARESARGEEDGSTVKTALRLFALLGLTGSVIMCLLAPLMASMQGDASLLRCYLYLSPSVALVALLAVVRGYFQGKGDMTPTAVSELIEQVTKAGVGLFFAYRYHETPALAAAYVLFAVTISEAVALIILLLRYKGEYHVRKLRAQNPSGTQIFFLALPVMVAASLLPLSQTVDSIVIVRLLGLHTPNAVARYGLFAGGATSLVGLSSTACYGLAAASVPAVSAAVARGDHEEGRKRAIYALLFTMLLSVPCGLGLFLFAKPIVALLFPSLTGGEAELLVRLVKLMSVSAVSLAGVDTLAACLTGMGRAKNAALGMLVAVVVKLVIQLALVGDARIGIVGAAAAANICYLIAFFLDLFYTVRKQKEGYEHDHDNRVRGKRGGRHPQGAQGNEGSGRGHRAHRRSRLGTRA